jgi:EmrB/QacA subfamily drug resistance transporter
MAWAEALLSDLHCVFHSQFLAMRHRAQPWPSSPVSSLARRIRRRLAADGAGHLGRYLPPEKRGLAFALYGVTAICAPAIGPTLGGWITDNYSWRWVFYINVPVGALAIALVYHLVEDPPYLARLKKRLSGFDFIGFSLLTLGVGALQIALDKGQEDDWLGCHFITTLIVIAVVGLVSLVIWEWFHKEPVVDVRLFKNFNFATSSLMFLMLGMASFSSTVLMPQLLQTLMGYTAQKAGMVISAGALVVLVVLPIDLPIPSAPSYCLWLDNTGGEHARILQTDRSAHEL